MAFVLVAIAVACAAPARAADPIEIENAKPGDSYWMAATQDGTAANPVIDGYSTATSVRAGQTIGFHVTTTGGSSASPVRYRIEIDRLGWYGGSGGRRLACLTGATLDPTCTHDEPGLQRPPAPSPDPTTGKLDAGWPVTDSLAVPAAWTSGYYLAVFRVTSGPSAGQTGFTPFIVQAPVGDRSAILVQVPTNTWQAYNTWGGEDLYTSPRAVKVSFNRPSAHRQLFNWEYPLVRFLERGGWDVSYVTDDNIDADPALLLDHQLDMAAGHDEYWTGRMRDGWQAARDAGVNLAFMGSDAGFWQVRYEDNDRTMVGYKYTTTPDPNPDPAQRTIEFRQLGRPECELEGVEFGGTILGSEYPNYTVTPGGAADPWFAGTGLSAGAVLSGLVGYETDEIVPNCHVPPPEPLLTYSGPPAAPWQPPAQAEAVRYTACSGAEVFASGSLQFAWGLDSFRDPGYAAATLPPEPPASVPLQQAMSQALADLTRRHAPFPGPPEICVPSVSFKTSTVRPGVGQRVLFQSTAIDKYGQIAGQAWDLTGTGAFNGPTGSTAIKAFAVPGVYNVGLRVTDSSGASAIGTAALPVCPCPNPRPGRGSEANPATTCSGVPFGTLRVRGGRLWFSPAAGVSRFTLRAYTLRMAKNGATRRTRRAAFTSVGAARLRINRRGELPLLIELSTNVAGTAVQEQFLLSSSAAARSVAPSALAATACGGTAAAVLTPLFGGPRATPIKVLLAGHGRVTVALFAAGHSRRLGRSTVSLRHQPAEVTLPSAGLRPGRYELRITTRTPGRGGRVLLDALAV